MNYLYLCNLLKTFFTLALYLERTQVAYIQCIFLEGEEREKKRSNKKMRLKLHFYGYLFILLYICNGFGLYIFIFTYTDMQTYTEKHIYMLLFFVSAWPKHEEEKKREKEVKLYTCKSMWTNYKNSLHQARHDHLFYLEKITWNIT